MVGRGGIEPAISQQRRKAQHQRGIVGGHAGLEPDAQPRIAVAEAAELPKLVPRTRLHVGLVIGVAFFVMRQMQKNKPVEAQAATLQGPAAVKVLQRLAPEVADMTFMQFKPVVLLGVDCYVSRSGYTGEDGFEISVPADKAEQLARVLLAQPEVKPIGLGARNSLRLEAGLCLYGNDIDTTTTPPEAALNWAIQKVRRTGGARAGGFPGADKVLAQIDNPASLQRKRVGLVALERVPVREHTELQSEDGQKIGEVTSGLLGPTVNEPVAMGYVTPAFAAIGTRVNAIVRGKAVPMEVRAMPFTPARYYRG